MLRALPIYLGPLTLAMICTAPSAAAGQGIALKVACTGGGGVPYGFHPLSGTRYRPDGVIE